MEAPNYNYIRQLSGGDPEFEHKLLAVIRDEFPKEREIFEFNIERGDHAAASKNVHKLKHKFSILGLEQSYRLADEFEEDLKHSRLERLSSFTAVLEQITAFLKQV